MSEARQKAVKLIDEACNRGARRSQACALLGLNERTLRRWRADTGGDRRKAAAEQRIPANKLSEQERQQIIELCNLPGNRSLPPGQIVPKLADEGRYIASESSFYRILAEVGQNNRRGRAEAPRQLPKPKGYKATAANQLWSWDITFLASAIRGSFYRLYLIEDIYSRKIVGWEVHENESAEHASKLIRKSCLAERVFQPGLVLHADNGSPMKGSTMLATLQRLGIVPSFSRPSVSDDNPYSESLFRTLKYTPSYPGKPFESLDAAREWVSRFVQWYNEVHRHSKIGFVTPGQRHRGEDRQLLKMRKAVYEAAKAANPERWSGNTRNWSPIEEVWLNPPKGKTEDAQSESLAA